MAKYSKLWGAIAPQAIVLLVGMLSPETITALGEWLGPIVLGLSGAGVYAAPANKT